MYGWLVLLPYEFISLSKHITGAAVFLSNLILYQEVGYFDCAAVQKPLLHLWSLAIEEQFYIVWPLLLWGIFYVTRRKILAAFYPKILLAAVLSTTIFGFCMYIYLNSYNPNLAFYFTGARIWELSLGALGAWYAHFGQKIKFSTYAQEWLSFSSMAIILVSFFVLTDRTVHFSFLITLPVLSTLFLLLSSESFHRTLVERYFLTQPILVFLGLISYPMYLLHWPCISFFHIISDNSFNLTGELTAKLCIFMGVICASYGIYRHIETPIRKKTSSISVIVLVGLMGILGILGQFGYFSYLKPYTYHCFPDSEKITNAINDWEYPTKNMKKIEGLFYTLGPGPHRILFLGDSNAQQYASRIDKLIASGKSKKSAIFFAPSGLCPLPNVGRSEEDIDLRNKGMRYACDHSEIQTVVIAALWGKYFRNEDKVYSYYHSGKKRALTEGDALNLAIKDFETFISKLIAQGKKVYFVTSIPCGPSYDPKSFFARTFIGTSFLPLKHAPRTDWDKANAQSTQILNRIAKNTGAILIHPEDFFCNQKSCRTYHTDGTAIYRDATHLRATYVAEYVTFLDFLFLE